MKRDDLKSRLAVMLTVSILAILIMGGFFGCATKPAARKAEAPPDWVFNPPMSDDEYFYFTGSGSSKSGDLAKGEEIARGVVIDEIMKYLGVKITSETTATAKGSLDSFQADVVQQLKSTSSGRVSGLEVADRWIERRGEAVTVYLLVRYNRNDLLKEKKRLEELFKEKVEAVSGPEREAKELETEGKYFEAAVKYIEASSAAFKSDIENADVKFERNINSAKEVIARLNLVKLNDNIEGYVGKPLPEPIKAKVVAGATAEDRGIANVLVRVSYTEVTRTGRKRIKSLSLKSDENGVVTFNHPIPTFIGSEKVTMYLDLSQYLENLTGVPAKYQGLVDGLEEAALSKKVVFTVTTKSMARKIPMGISIADTDASGKLIEQNETENGLLDILSGEGFKVSSLPLERGELIGKSNSEVLDIFSKLAEKGKLKNIERVIYGYAKISGYEQDKDVTVVKVTGNVKVVNLSDGEILLSVKRTKSAIGNKVSTALVTAFHKLGEDMGKEIARKLQ